MDDAEEKERSVGARKVEAQADERRMSGKGGGGGKAGGGREGGRWVAAETAAEAVAGSCIYYLFVFFLHGCLICQSSA